MKSINIIHVALIQSDTNIPNYLLNNNSLECTIVLIIHQSFDFLNSFLKYMERKN